MCRRRNWFSSWPAKAGAERLSPLPLRFALRRKRAAVSRALCRQPPCAHTPLSPLGVVMSTQSFPFRRRPQSDTFQCPGRFLRNGRRRTSGRTLRPSPLARKTGSLRGGAMGSGRILLRFVGFGPLLFIAMGRGRADVHVLAVGGDFIVVGGSSPSSWGQEDAGQTCERDSRLTSHSQNVHCCSASGLKLS